MIARYAIGIVALIASAPALAEPLDAAAAQRFVLGKLFAFTCFDGSRGAGRVYGDGSVMGTVQLRGAGSIYSVWLPAGTLKVKGETVCASLSGTPFEPCFDLNRTDDQGFRGSVSGLDFAYCDFAHRPDMNGKRAHLQPSKPLSLDPPRNKQATSQELTLLECADRDVPTTARRAISTKNRSRLECNRGWAIR